jgi:hypothetical protein
MRISILKLSNMFPISGLVTPPLLGGSMTLETKSLGPLSVRVEPHE